MTDMGQPNGAPPYMPRFAVPIPERLAGRLPRSVREQKVHLEWQHMSAISEPAK